MATGHSLCRRLRHIFGCELPNLWDLTEDQKKDGVRCSYCGFFWSVRIGVWSGYFEYYDRQAAEIDAARHRQSEQRRRDRIKQNLDGTWSLRDG